MILGKKHSFKYKVFLLITLAVSIIILSFQLTNIDPKLLLYGDYIQYWAAGRLLITGENPYDFEKVVEYKQSEGKIEYSEKYYSPMLYPPWILPILIPFSFENYGNSRIAWLFFHIVVVFFTSRALWKLYAGNPKQEWISYLLVFSFTPTIYVLGTGHITSLHLLGITIFILLTQQQIQNWKCDFFAGFFVSLIFYKPHLLFIYFIIVFLWAIYNRRWWIIIGSITFLLVNTLIAIIIYPDVVTHYIESIRQYPISAWATPTIGMIIRLLLGYEFEWLQLIPTLIGILLALIYWRLRLNQWNWFEMTPILILISYTFSPYMWIYDMVVLVLPIMYLFIKYINNRNLKDYLKTLLVSYLLINIAAFYIDMNYYEYILFWFCPLLFIWYLFWNWISVKRTNVNKFFNNQTI